MTKFHAIRILAGLVCLLAISACTPNNSLMISGYDAEGVRTGSLIPSAGTLTPY